MNQPVKKKCVAVNQGERSGWYKELYNKLFNVRHRDAEFKV